MQNNNRTATTGEVSFYNEIRGKKITAVVGHSNRGKGWRPVCGGKFLGEEVFENEGAAISGGKRFISDLTQRVINADSKYTASAEVLRNQSSESSPTFTGTFTHADGSPLIVVKEQEIPPLIFPVSKKSKRSRKKDLVKND
jgi:hypothetical protein